MSDNYDLTEFHNRLCLLMNEIHKICIDNNINYTLLGGTLIGALRHKGFIPWDDDIDIGMTYDNYKRFVEVAFSLDHEWLEFDLAGRTDNYYCPFIKAYDSRTTLIEGDRDIPRGIFIDIFPIVYAGKTKAQSYLSFKYHRFLQALMKRKAYHYETGYTREKLLNSMANLFSIDFLMSLINSQYEKLNKQKKEWSSDMDGTFNGIVPSDIFDNYQLYDFGSFRFMGMKDADRYLRLVFGDYMKMPPIEKQIPHHINYLNMNLPYRNYSRDDAKRA